MSQTINDLVLALMGVPSTLTYLGRNTLLTGMNVNLNRSEGDRSTDLNAIVQGLLMAQPDGSYVVQVIDNAAALVPNTEAARTLRQLREKILQEYGAAALPNGREPQPGSPADPQYFDLSELVSDCFDILFPDKRGLFGFSVACDSQHFLRCFAERPEISSARRNSWRKGA
jgi:hypothetical protein